MNAPSIVILAAGQGTRMRSALPKVLQPLAGKPLLAHIKPLFPTKTIIIFGHQGEQVRAAFPQPHYTWVEQKQQLGTGHAVQQALSEFPKSGQVLVMVGDAPLINSDTLQQLIKATPSEAIGLLTTLPDNPTGLGRIIRNKQGAIEKIIEEKDATPAERAIQEINTGIYVFPAQKLATWLPRIQPSSVSGEYYLTEVLALAKAEKCEIVGVPSANAYEVMGVNDKRELAIAERYYQEHQAKRLMYQGVTVIDPKRFDLRGELTVGQDVLIDTNVILEGVVTIGNRCTIGAHSVLKNVTIGDDVIIKSHCVLEEAIIGDHAEVGPFARLRPGTKLAAHVHVGNFAEIKKSDIGPYSKVHHVSYIGDTTIGEKVNIGAGTIVCNYDGAKKSQTVIEDGAFIGSNSSLVAPVKIGKQAVIGAGSVITRDAPAGELTIARNVQKNCGKWPRSSKDRQKGEK
jgi:bifunctional UDP-N-acetylglucosamine pyrophosphorylase / glucosamine-1-phosphate N-acetyltransferase